MKLNYWEMVAVGWRILWQGIGGFVVTLFLGNLVVLGVLPELTRSDPSYWALAVPLLGAFVLALCIVASRRPRSDQRPIWDLPTGRQAR